MAEYQKIQNQMPRDDLLFDAADLFKTLGDSTRIRILSALTIEELCVQDISAVISMSMSAVSHQLRVLKQAKLVKSRREGKEIFYSLSDDHVINLVASALEHAAE